MCFCLIIPYIVSIFYSFSSKRLVIPNKSSTFTPPEPAKPLNDAPMCGSFYFYTMSNRIPFQKPYTSAHDLVCLLQSRGLTVTDTSKAESYLEYEGQDWFTSCRLPGHWYRSNGLSPWVGERAPVAIGTIIQGGRGWKLCTFSPFFWKKCLSFKSFSDF